jgi:hypothetical protein
LLLLGGIELSIITKQDRIWTMDARRRRRRRKRKKKKKKKEKDY